MRGAPRLSGISTVVQVQDGDSLQETLLLMPGERMPSWGPLPLDALRRKRQKRVVGGSAVDSALVAGARDGAHLWSYARFTDLDDPLVDDALPAMRQQSKVLLLSAGAVGLVGVGPGAVTVWRF